MIHWWEIDASLCQKSHQTTYDCSNCCPARVAGTNCTQLDDKVFVPMCGFVTSIGDRCGALLPCIRMPDPFADAAFFFLMVCIVTGLGLGIIHKIGNRIVDFPDANAALIP